MDDDQQITGGQQLSAESASGAAYFESPRQAVEAIKEMQGDEDWASLACYYDLEGSGIDRQTLIAGDFFIRSERPELAHPGGFWRYKHPFAPSFEYAFATSAAESGIVIVRVSISIDQGAGSPAQEGWQEFLMRKSAAGFQVMPGDAGLIERELPGFVDPAPTSADIPKD